MSRMRNSQGRPLLWLVGAIAGLSLLSVATASLGDRLPEFKECVEVRILKQRSDASRLTCRVLQVCKTTNCENEELALR